MLANNSITYCDFLKDAREPLQIRLAIVRRYNEIKNVTHVALEFNTTRKTVRKWVKRFSGAISSLKNVSTAPKEPHRQIAQRTEDLLVAFKKKNESLGYDYIHYYLLEHNCTEIPSRSTCYAIWKKYGFSSKTKKKHETKKDLREVKAKYKPFEKIQIDVKELKDIPNYLDQSYALALKKQKEVPIKYGLPMYQYTARDIKTGTLFVAHAYGHNRHTAAIFADRVITHLNNYGIVPRVIQTDNGTEFCNTRDALDLSPLFIQVVTKDDKIEHRRIPPRAKTWQSDVETSHWIIEKEFYNTIKAISDTNMITKLRAYQWGFNVLRKNRYKGNRTPLEILREEDNLTYATLPKEIMDFPTCILDEKFDAFMKGGYHVGLPTKSTDERLTSRSGEIVFGEYLKAIGIDKLCDKYLPQPKSNRGYAPFNFIQPLLLMMHSGGHSLDDLRMVQDDKAMREVLHINKVPTADGTGKWLKRHGLIGMYGIERMNQKLLKRYIKRIENPLVLDIDASVIESHKSTAEYTYKMFPGFTPMIGHINGGYIIHNEFRSGNIAPADHNLSFVKRCEAL